MMILFVKFTDLYWLSKHLCFSFIIGPFQCITYSAKLLIGMSFRVFRASASFHNTHQRFFKIKNKIIGHKKFEILIFTLKPKQIIPPYTPTPGEYYGYVFFIF